MYNVVCAYNFDRFPDLEHAFALSVKILIEKNSTKTQNN